MDTKKIYPVYFTFGALAIYFLLCFLPGIVGLFYSFTDWNTYSKEVNFVGISNYLDVFKGGSDYGLYIKNTFVFTVITTLLKTVFGVSLALLFTSPKIRMQNFHRMVVFSPQIMAFLIVGIVFRNLLHPTTGFINVSLRGLGLGFIAKNWLTDLKFAFPTVMAVDLWKGIGYIMVVVIAGLKSIPETYYEAAEIDGANYFQKFKNITLPLLSSVLINVTVLNLTYGFRVFDIVFSLTNGGPGNATAVMNTAIYKEFSKGNYAMGTTLSSLLFLFIMSISYFILKSMENQEVDV